MNSFLFRPSRRPAARPRFAFASLLVLLLLALSPAASAQYLIKGVTLDRDTKEPIPFVSIGVKGTTAGTTSNASGEFSLRVPTLPALLMVSELSHQRDSVQVTSANESLQITLAAANIVLPEVEVKSYAATLVTRAYAHMKRHYDQNFYGKAYYRQITRLDNDPTELQEMIWNVKSSNARIEGTSLAQARYAAKDAIINFRNFSFYTRAYGLYDARADSTKSLALLSPNVADNYILEIGGIIQQGDRDVAEINFETSPKLTKYHAKGTVWIDVDNYKVARFHITTPTFTGTANNPTYKFRNTKLEFDLVFQNTPGPVSPLDHINTTLSFDIERPGVKAKRMNVAAYTFFYETGSTPGNAVYRRPALDENDLDEIRKTKYDPEFWANNPVVKRTPLEDEVAESFEKKGAFGTMVKPKPAAPPVKRRGY
ncbi:carboxypeptidase-like regulatory domain-containing protein [Hymenobacter sp. B81]|uniref:carboxypeptidase-like regulatory domain-containing protein n=1 Tax=Hymenobacter sp. B81 TaxID=3344878 RepID=UPI0037DCC7E6